MPSFRATLQILGLRPGREPEEVLDRAVEAVASRHVVEAKDIDIRRGVPVIIVRYAVPDTGDTEEVAEAHRSAEALREHVAEVARTGRLQVLRRVKGRWIPR
ncbi:hypothetical protein [Mariniluteicoccus flavus]